MMNRDSWLVPLLLAVFFLPVISSLSGQSSRLPHPIFYQSFDRGGDAWLRGGLTHRFTLDVSCQTDGRDGHGYHFEPPFTNLLPVNQASPTPHGFVAGGHVALSECEGYGEAAGLAARGPVGTLWRNTIIELSGLQSPYRDRFFFLASAYLRSVTPGVRVRLTLVDETDSEEWQAPILEANRAARERDAAARVKDPLATESHPGEIELGNHWQRLTASLSMDTRRPQQRLYLRLEVLPPENSGDVTAEIHASALQLEHLRYPDLKNYAGTWRPGGESAGDNALSMPLQPLGFNHESGAISCWVRLPAPDGGGTPGGPLVTVGGGWWRPVWSLGTGRCYGGDGGRERYTVGKSLLDVSGAHQQRMRDGEWHFLTLTWSEEGLLLYLDGEEVARAEYLVAPPPENAPLWLGRTTLDGHNAKAILDEVAIWDRALTAAEITVLHASGTPLRRSLPEIQLERPDRLIFHRGEAEAALSFVLRASAGRPYPELARLRIPALGVDREFRIDAAGRAGEIVIHPWRASPGKHPLRLHSADGALDVETTVEIVPQLPSTDFYMLGWTSSPAVRSHGFTAELTGVGGLETVLRRGMLASLRFDARRWHPLAPETLAASLESATQTACRTVVYPHIVASMVNTEVGIQGLPDAPWFRDWMHRETGLAAVPEDVLTGPLRIRRSGDAPPAIVPADDPAWRFARWLRGEGKGWPTLNAGIADAMREQGLANVLFYTDQPSTAADLKGLDLVDFWDYPHVPSGLVVEFNRVGNIARLAGQKLSLMPGTIYWDPWPFHIDQKMVCLSPDTMRQYLWITIGNPLDHLGLFGFGSLEKDFIPEGLPETLTRTMGDIYPFGMLTGGLPGGSAPVAYLHTSGQWWQGPGDHQWVEWWFNRMATRALAEARLHGDYIGDEHVEAGWLERYAAVVVLGAWRIPAPIHDALMAYAANGGKLVVDKRYRAPLPENATVLEFDARTSPDVAAVLAEWASGFLAQNPATVRLRPGDDAWLFTKTDGDAQFIFVVNDRMAAGLLGDKHGLSANLGTSTGVLRDRGLEQRVVLTVPTGGALYDVRAHRQIPLTADGVALDLAPADAAVLALVPEPIGRLRVATPQALEAGGSGMLSLEVMDSAGARLRHRNLLEITATDAAGRALDLQRYHRLNDGHLDLPLRLPLDIPAGDLRIEVKEWISGQTATRQIQVLGRDAAGGGDHPGHQF